MPFSGVGLRDAFEAQGELGFTYWTYATNDSVADVLKPRDFAPLVSKRVAAAAATKTKAELEQYAGTYQSEELGVTYQLVAGDSSLTIKTRWGVDRNLQPAWGDVFGGAYLVRFTRKGGKIDGFLMSSGRVRGVRFERVAELRKPG